MHEGCEAFANNHTMLYGVIIVHGYVEYIVNFHDSQGENSYTYYILTKT